ncbi:hypothetical protein EUTSA_v10011546mg [Eutrema salsugineum]|uniref:START domain-containing protein n=1 Tax=Eutrema salsugineum TaxID=72664 RepID=V4KIY9_EUTSA|nr:uncharacterized protein LOC18011390 isoform X2 [Eutrema salsugineum]ESQ29867.1 hypothetical protein EUTSA_v10011546mg [Eutrema salsugineum]
MNSVPNWSSYFSSDEFSRRAVFDGGGAACYFWATAISLLFILLFHLFCSAKFRFFDFASSSSSSSSSSPSHADSVSHAQSRLVSDEDLKSLIEHLEERNEAAEIWENVIHKSNDRISYTAKRCKPQGGGPMQYLSVTVFEDCSAEILRDFYMDNDYRKQWDKTVVEHEQLQVDSNSGIEIGRTIKKFPLLTSREYVLAWKLWEGKDTFYCFTKECDHNMVPRQRKYVRVSYFRSGWRIRRVPGRNACEIKMFHQEDAGLNVEMAKLAFSKGVWSYICKMENALRKYIAISHRPQVAILSAVSLINKVPSELESQTEDVTASMGTSSGEGIVTHVARQKKVLRKPSKKLITNGLVLVGGAICLSRGHSALGAKLALAYLLTKLNKRGTPLKQTTQNTRS